jgi:integrase
MEWVEQHHAHLMSHGRQAQNDDEENSEPKKDWTVAELIEAWLKSREGTSSHPDDGQELRDYVKPVIGKMKASELRPKHAVGLVEAMRKRKSRKGGVLAPRTVRGAFTLIRQVFQWAVLHEHVLANPVVVPKGTLPQKMDKDPAWRIRARFSRDEVESLITDIRIPLYRRVAYALEFLAGLRTGEASALTWGDHEKAHEPLGKLLCYQSWNGHQKRLKATKIGVAREIPVHPALAKVLADWKLMGWAATYSRAPKQNELIIPSTEGGYRCVNYAWKSFVRDLDALGLRKRRHHDSRRTFISLALDGGASKEVLQHITHPSPRDAFDLYTTPSWEARCAAVQCLKVSLERGRVVEIAANRGANVEPLRFGSANG